MSNGQFVSLAVEEQADVGVADGFEKGERFVVVLSDALGLVSVGADDDRDLPVRNPSDGISRENFARLPNGGNGPKS